MHNRVSLKFKIIQEYMFWGILINKQIIFLQLFIILFIRSDELTTNAFQSNSIYSFSIYALHLVFYESRYKK